MDAQQGGALSLRHDQRSRPHGDERLGLDVTSASPRDWHQTMRGNARTAHINVRVSPEERAAIAARSSRYGMAPSTFMREAALLRDEKPVRVADTEELRALRTDLKRAGNLLNQSARLGNTYGLDDTGLKALEAAVRRVSDAASRISEVLARASDGK